MTSQEIPLHGGNVSTVVRVGDTVRRNAGPWTPAVHALLRHLEYVGFTGAPRALGMDERNREVLSYLEGECGEYPLAPHWVTDEALVTVATMLRMFHDAQYGFQPPPSAVWRSFGPPPPDTEVICHHDAAPHNVSGGRTAPSALIDFDLASPGARIYDVAYAAWTWVPLFSDRDSYTLGWKRPEPAAPAAAVRRRVRADPPGPAPAGPDHPQADRRPRRGDPPDGGGRRPGVRPDRAQGPSAPPDARSAAARLRAAHPGVRPAVVRVAGRTRVVTLFGGRMPCPFQPIVRTSSHVGNNPSLARKPRGHPG